jgi:hydroxymethylglutaryl-CoA lyase
MFRLCDVSLRDGLQSLKKIYTFNEKKKLLHKVLLNNPTSIEIGSIVSPRILPQMKDSIKLYKYAESEFVKSKFVFNGYYYMLVPNEKGINTALKNNIFNFSLITSVSESFQKKNTNTTINETKSFIEKVYFQKNLEKKINKLKIYISCINYCPLEGLIDTSKIIDEINYYSKYKNTTICLSDTCGNLCYKDFISIMKNINDTSNISLHLHYNKKNISNVEKIIKYAYQNNICEYDVSCIDAGGCSVTMGNNNLNGNLNYEIMKKLNI